MSADPQTIAAARQALSSGDLDRAETLAQSARTVPALALDAVEVLALSAKARGTGDRFEALLREAIALAPDRPWPRDDLAEWLHDTGRLHEAEAVLRETLIAQPNNASAHMRLGNLLSEREELVEGAEHLEAAIRVAGRHPQLLTNLGRNLQRQGRLDEAAPLLADAARAMPEALPPLAWLAELEEQAGRFDRASALLDRAEVLALRQGTDVTLQRVTLLSRTDGWEKGLSMLEAEAEPSGAARLLRGRLRDRAGRKAEAWDDFVAGKAALAAAASRTYPARAVGELIQQWQDFFTGDRFAEFTPAPRRKGVPQPVFVLGFPRSGTTLTEQVLASHSLVRAGGELPFGRELAEKAAGLTAGAFPRHPDAVTEEQRETLGTQLRDHYLARAERYGLLREGAMFFTDKMPLNELYLPLLQLAFPQSPVVVVSRDPRDVMISAMSHDFTHGFACGYRIEDLALHYARMEKLTGHWIETLPVPAHELGYEHFVADQEQETTDLMAWLGLDAEAAQLSFHTLGRHAPTPSYAQVQEPLNRRSIGRWKGYARELAPVLPVLSEAVERGGYAASDSPEASEGANDPTIN
ncbi:sulfotransferase [Novosphingobium sp. BL-8H]|uniref:sulfotransferase n=1 Tax=Novosphingobium sp. BL-8H TaxID=3127640 RepID=UPI003756CBA6